MPSVVLIVPASTRVANFPVSVVARTAKGARAATSRTARSAFRHVSCGATMAWAKVSGASRWSEPRTALTFSLLAYAYLPPGAKNFCSEQYITCNSDYGTSIGRGSITFVTGKWTTVWLYVALNTVGTRNGVVSLYVNGAQAFYVDDLELRASSAINSIGGLYFSTFFGGFDASWASPSTQYTYFRNITLVGGLGESNATGSKTGAATTAVVVPRTGLIAGVTAGILAVALGFVY